MARNFLQFPSAPYQGVPSSKAFNGPRGQQKGLMVGFNINWANYTALSGNFAVTLNLNAAGPNTVASGWTISSVYIDNEGVDFPVYVFFPSTGFAISCPQNSAGWFQVFTLDRVAIVAGIAIPAIDIAAKILTNVFFTDVAMVPYLDQEQQTSIALEIASPTISRGNLANPGFAPPALGDQMAFNLQNVPVQNAGGTVSAFGGPQPSGFIYITSVCAAFAQLTAPATTGLVSVVFENRNTGQELMEWDGSVLANSVASFNVMNMSNMNIKLDATQFWQLRVRSTNIQTGIINVYMAYSIVP